MRSCWISMRSSRKCGGWYIASLPSPTDALRRAPSLQRGPQAAVEAEAVDRRRACDRPDAQQARAGPLEAALLQHTARRRIGDACRRLHRFAVEVGEGVVDQRAHRFSGVAFAPVLDAEPVADLRRVPVDLCEPAGADDLGFSLDAIAQRHQEYGFVAEVSGGDKILGVGRAIRMRNARRVLGDAAIV